MELLGHRSVFGFSRYCHIVFHIGLCQFAFSSVVHEVVGCTLSSPILGISFLFILVILVDTE